RRAGRSTGGAGSSGFRVPRSVSSNSELEIRNSELFSWLALAISWSSYAIASWHFGGNFGDKEQVPLNKFASKAEPESERSPLETRDAGEHRHREHDATHNDAHHPRARPHTKWSFQQQRGLVGSREIRVLFLHQVSEDALLHRELDESAQHDE